MNLTGCMSVEFLPEDGYYNHRQEDVEKVEIRLREPELPYYTLGTLVIRDQSGSPLDENFRNMLQREIRKYGAQGGWIQKRRMRQAPHYRTQSVNSGMDHHAAGSQRTQGMDVYSSFSIIRVLLYTYE